jgi:tetratricopeptide (TPR) repeat protein
MPSTASPAPEVEAARTEASDAPAAAPGNAAAEQQFGALFRQGYQSFHQERYAAALDQFQQAVQTAPHLAEGHYYLGLTYAQMMMQDKAEQEYRAALERMPDLRPAEEKLCILLYERGRYDEAIERLRPMIEQNPRDTFALGELAINYLAKGDAATAIPLLEQYNQLSGPQAWGLAHLGRAYDLHEQPERAEQLYQQALKLDPYFAVAHYWLGLLWGREGNQQAAQEAFATYDRFRNLLNTEQTLGMKLLRNADDVATLVRLAKVRYAVGKRKEALLALERAHQLAPNHAEVAQLRRQWSADRP